MNVIKNIVRLIGIGFAEMNRKNAFIWGCISLSAGIFILIPSVGVGSNNYFLSISGTLIYLYIMWELPRWFPLYVREDQ